MLYMFLWVTLLVTLGYLYSIPQGRMVIRWLPGGKPLRNNVRAGIITAATAVIIVVLNLVYTMTELVSVVAVLFSVELFVGGVCRHWVDVLDKGYDQMPADKQSRYKQEYLTGVCVLTGLRLSVLWLAAAGLIIAWVRYF